MLASDIDVTVSICTWNRAKYLDATLNRFRDIVVPEDLRWELLVVDNNSTDDTRAVIASHARELPLRYAFEQNQGLSYARNRAVSEARGGVIIWTDDDVVVDRRWLLEYCCSIDSYQDVTFFGGPIEPLFEENPTRWVLQNFDILKGAFGGRDLGNEEFYFTKSTGFPFGANMAVRKEAYRDILYDVHLGRIGSGMLAGEETALFEHLVSRGRSGVWLPRARVKHLVPPEKATKDYVRSYLRGYGRTLTRTSTDILNYRGPRVFGVPRWIAWRFAKTCGRFFCAMIMDNRKAAESWIALQVLIGEMDESCKRSRPCGTVWQAGD